MAANRRDEESATHEPREITPLLSGRVNHNEGHHENRQASVAHQGAEGEDGSANQHVRGGRGALIAIGLWGLIFLQAANMSGLTTTQSSIAEDLNAFASTTWFTSTYLIAMSSTSPLSARLASIFSPRLCVFFASILLGIGGIVTSQATVLHTFLIGRAITGLGGSGIMTVSFILILELTSKKRRGIFIGLLNTGFTTGVSFGAIIFGALLDPMGWRFLFWAQAPIAFAFGTTVYYSIPGSFSARNGKSGTIMFRLGEIDYLGAVTLTSSICLFLFGLSSTTILWLPIVASIFILGSFVYIEVYFTSDPIIPITVLRSRGALLSCVTQLGLMAARWSVLFYTPTYAIAVRGWSPTSAGSILVPTNAGFAIGGILVGWLHINRAGSFYVPSIISYICFAITLFIISQITTSSSPAPLFLLVVFLNGLSTGAALNYTLAHLLHLTPPSAHYIATALLTTFRGFAGSFGSAIGGGLFTRTLRHGLENGFKKHGGLQGREDLVRRLLGSPNLVQELHGTERMIATTGYVDALRRLFLAGVMLVLVMTLVQAGTGWKAGVEVNKTHDTTGRNDNLTDDERWEESVQ